MFHLLTILMFFNLVSGSCCHKVKVDYTWKNDAYNYGQRSEYFGYYTMQAGFVNRKAHFLKDDGKGKAIWYFSDSRRAGWVVGLKSDLGSPGGFFFVSSKADCPDTLGYTWKYYDHQYKNWRDAYKGFTIRFVSW